MKIVSVEVDSVAGDWKEVTGRWHEITRQLQEATNRIWRLWLVWHTTNDSATKIRTYLDNNAKWKADPGRTKENQPACPVKAVAPELSKMIYDNLTAGFPHINGSVMEVVRHSTLQKLNARKAASGKLSGWMAILLDHESAPSSTRAQPIPFNKKVAKFVAPEKASDNFTLRAKLTRVPTPGKKNSPSKQDVIQLRTHSRSAAKAAATLKKIASGEYEFKGSNLIYSKSKRKWFAQIAYQVPEVAKPQLDENKTAILHPMRDQPWCLHMPGRRAFPGGYGRHVTETRERLIRQRLGRAQGYRYAGSANKGHGRERAMAPQFRLRERWKDFVKTANNVVTKNVIDCCLRDGIGKLVYLQPADGRGESRFLASAGKLPDARDSTGWDWYQVRTQLEQKCQAAGITLEIRKCGDKRQVAA